MGRARNALRPMSADDEERVLLQVRADELKQKTTKDEGWTELGGCDLCLVQRKSTLDGTPSLLIVARRQDEKSVEVSGKTDVSGPRQARDPHHSA